MPQYIKKLKLDPPPAAARLKCCLGYIYMHQYEQYNETIGYVIILRSHNVYFYF